VSASRKVQIVLAFSTGAHDSNPRACVNDKTALDRELRAILGERVAHLRVQNRDNEYNVEE
jgi:hypothetical protein